MPSIVEKFCEVRRKNHIEERGDIVALKRHFDGDWEKFIYAWAMREPAFVTAFYEGGFEKAKAVKTKYKYLPTRLVRWMKPNAVQEWDKDVVKSLASLLQQAGKSERLYKQTVKKAGLLPGIGQYSREHVYRTALCVCNASHPSKSFVEMGAGANKARYNLLRDEGIHDMYDLNEVLRELDEDEMDAGELAYLLCKIKSYEIQDSDFVDTGKKYKKCCR